MQNLLRLLLVMLFAVSLGGCSLFGDKIARHVAKGVEQYCGEPFAARRLVGDNVNARLAQNNHSIVVTCAGDPVP